MKKAICSLLTIVFLVSAITSTAMAKDKIDDNSQVSFSSGERIKYFIEMSSTQDKKMNKNLENETNYIEHYEITFYKEGEKDYESRASRALQSGDALYSSDESISIDTVNYTNMIIPYSLEIPVTNQKIKTDIDKVRSEGVVSTLRAIGVNVFFASSIVPANMASEISRVTNKDFKKSNDIIMQVSEQQDFPYMKSIIYAYEEYSGNQKRHALYSYNQKYNTYNTYTGSGVRFVNTTQSDSIPDTQMLSWSIGGAIGLYDTNIYLHDTYNMQCETCDYYYGATRYGYNTYYKNSGLTRNDVDNGTCIAFDIPDRAVAYCSMGHYVGPTYPSVLNLDARTGWFDIGYAGRDGVARTDYVHTYSTYSLNISFSIDLGGGISFGFDLTENSQFERAWVYVVINDD
jgi:hypothetical protein